ncbi:MAG: gliding motility-associated C-terminal domain-containing protein [Bacteroidetes bacterium]|nr:gliding motility-associated C-terminal domain-containing protein [Bacteroidota bacterium]
MYIKRFALSVILLIAAASIKAQLCTGGLGDPVVNITFGTGTTPDFNFTPPSAYTYTSNTCPNDGSYTITTSTSGCFGSNWHTVSSDHTGGGAFMLVNASFNPGDFFRATVSGLCPNTTYEFAAWVMNVLKDPGGIRPDITFSIETTTGAVLNQFNTGGIPATAAPRWDKYGFFFTTTTGSTSVVLRITNNAPGGNGNDIALDDITFRPCGPAITSVIQGGGIQEDICVYEQTDYQFDATLSTGLINPVYQWQLSRDTGATWQDIPGANALQYIRQPTDAGHYQYRLTVAEAGNAGIPGCRVASNVLTIFVHTRPLVKMPPERILIKGNSIALNATVTGDAPVFTWTPPTGLSDITIVNPLASPTSDIVYKLTATSEFGCTADGFVRVKVVDGIFVPTGFTPNNDGKNDYWTIPYLDPAFNATVMVYNRYGQLVYQVTGDYVNWDGTIKGVPQPSGTFIYLIQFPEKYPMMKGVVTLVR